MNHAMRFNPIGGFLYLYNEVTSRPKHCLITINVDIYSLLPNCTIVTIVAVNAETTLNILSALHVVSKGQQNNISSSIEINGD